MYLFVYIYIMHARTHTPPPTTKECVRVRSLPCWVSAAQDKVTSDTRNQENFLQACELSSQLLQTVTAKYPEFCRHHGHSTVIPAPLFWIGDASQDALASFEYVNESQVRIGKTEVTLSLDAGVAGGLLRGSRRGY